MKATMVSVKMLVSDLELLKRIANFHGTSIKQEITESILKYLSEQKDDPRIMEQIQIAAKRINVFTDALLAASKAAAKKEER